MNAADGLPGVAGDSTQGKRSRGTWEVRRGRQRQRFDLLQLLLEARDADTGDVMSDAEVVDEVMTLVVAGHETTASTLNWTWWLLATHPEITAIR